MTTNLSESIGMEGARPAIGSRPSMPRLLVVTPFFAPVAAVGAKRFSFLSEVFQSLGYEVDTLTMRWGKRERLDPTLPLPGRVHRIRSAIPHESHGDGLVARLYNRIMTGVIGVPDNFIGWLPTSLVRGRRIVGRGKPDIIVATGPPFTAFLIGAFLSRSTGAPLILDYRDPWSSFEWSDSRFGKRMKRRSSRSLERWAVRHASALVFTSEVMKKRFEANFVGITPGMSRVITNGFNEPSELKPVSLTPNAINILYAGSFYGQRRLHVLIDALCCLQARSVNCELKFSIHVFGSLRADDRRLIAQTNLKNDVHEHAPVDYKTVLNFMKGADILYLPSGSRVTYALPFKIFDYLSVCRPILAVTPPESAVAQFVEDHDCGEVADDAEEAIANAVERILRRAQTYRFSGRGGYTWSSIAGRYARLMDELLVGADNC